MKKRKGWKFPKTREGRLAAEFVRLGPVLNEIFVRQPKLYHEFPDFKALIVRGWLGFNRLGMKMDGKVGATEIRYPLTKGDHGRIYAFLLFWWKVGDVKTHAELVKAVQEIERKLVGRGLEFKQILPAEGKVEL